MNRQQHREKWIKVLEEIIRHKNDLTFTQIENKWKDILDTLKHERVQAFAWLANGKPVVFGENRLVVCFASRIHRDACSLPIQRSAIEKSISLACGVNCKFHAVLEFDWEQFLEDYSQATVTLLPKSDTRTNRQNNQAGFPSSTIQMKMVENVVFRSNAEVQLYQPFKESGVLFFPLPIGISNSSRKEPDYLVCVEGKWGILEVQHDHTHPSVEKEAEKIKWFQDHKVNIRPYTYNEALNTPNETVQNFIEWLKKQ